MKKITIHSPGTIANLVCGFDILGLALKEPYDIMELALIDEPKIVFQQKGLNQTIAWLQKNRRKTHHCHKHIVNSKLSLTDL